MDIFEIAKNYIAKRKDATDFSYKGRRIFYITPEKNKYKKRFICIYEQDAKRLNMKAYVKGSGTEWDYQFKKYNHKIGAKLNEKYERNLENLIEELLMIYK